MKNINFFTVYLILFFYIISNNYILAQEPAQTAQSAEKLHAERIKKDYILGVYIPKDLTEAFVQLNRKIDDKSKAKFRSLPEEVAAHKLHFSLGRWMQTNWSFYEGSRFSDFLQKMGVFNPDDMAQFVIITYHRNLNKKELKAKDLVDAYQAKHKKEEEERLKKATVIKEEVVKKGTVVKDEINKKKN
jgi:hypothetical protein